MNVCVFGLWHLGTVTAACLAKAGFHVIGLDFDSNTIQHLKTGHAPVYEPGLDALLAQGLAAGRLDFTTEPAVALDNAEVLWVTFDTPVNDADEADVEFVRNQIVAVLDFVRPGAKVILSSQTPVGFTRALEDWHARQYPATPVKFAYSPENLRLGHAIQAFAQPDRIVIGVRAAADQADFEPVFAKISGRLEWMRTESAEMTKHGINAFLAASVAFANELATLCEAVGADAQEVARGLKSDRRIGPKAYLSPGAAYAGGTLARDIRFLIESGQRHQQAAHLFNAVQQSNEAHKAWAQNTCAAQIKDLRGKCLALLGLTYKPGTDTLRRSAAIELAQWLAAQGAQVCAFDPQIKTLPEHLTPFIALKPTVSEALAQADGVVIATGWPLLRELEEQIIEQMSRKIIIDANGLLAKRFERYPAARYFAVGSGPRITRMTRIKK